ncbi:hypothetical protein SRHO_G00214120 [Serrasalmus rhombeus]
MTEDRVDHERPNGRWRNEEQLLERLSQDNLPDKSALLRLGAERLWSSGMSEQGVGDLAHSLREQKAGGSAGATPGCTPCLTNPCSTLGLLTLIGSQRPSFPRAPMAFAKCGQRERKSGPRQPLAIHAPGMRIL